MAEDTIYYIIIVVAFAAVVGWWVYLEKKAKFRVRVKELVQGRKIVRDYRAFPYTDTEKVSWWKLMGERDKMKKLIPLPPEEAIELSHKGKKCTECYRFEDGTIIFCKDDKDVVTPPENLYSDIPKEILEQIKEAKEQSKKKEILDNWKKDKFKQWVTSNNIVVPTEPINTKTRMLYLNNIKKAEARKKTDWTTQLPTIVSVAGFILLLIALMIFYGEIAAPVLKANEQAITMEKLHTEQLQILKEIKLGVQSIGGDTGSGTNEPNKAPN